MWADRICHSIFPRRTSFSQNCAEKYPLKYFLIRNERTHNEMVVFCRVQYYTRKYMWHILQVVHTSEVCSVHTAHGQSGRDSGQRRWNEMKAQLTKLNINCRNVSNNFLPHFVLNSPSSTTRRVHGTNGNSFLFSAEQSRQSFSWFATCCNSCTDNMIPTCFFLIWMHILQNIDCRNFRGRKSLPMLSMLGMLP